MSLFRENVRLIGRHTASASRPWPSAVHFALFSPARRPSAVTQPVYFATMALLDRRVLAGNSPHSSHRLETPPCRSSGSGWKTRFISPWQDGILLPFQPGVPRDDALRLRQGLGERAGGRSWGRRRSSGPTRCRRCGGCGTGEPACGGSLWTSNVPPAPS